MKPHGPLSARVLLVGEAPGESEIARGIPFVGVSGQELDRMLSDAGFSRNQCLVTNVCQERPPGNDILEWVSRNKKRPDTPGDWVLHDGIWMHRPVLEGLRDLNLLVETVKPALIIGFGNLALWAFTRKWGITDWRGSQFVLESGSIFIPTLHPAAILRQWDQRWVVIEDLHRAQKSLAEGVQKPAYQFTFRPTFSQAISRLDDLLSRARAGPLTLAVDIETRWGHIACIGIGWSRAEALCIPLMCVEDREGYWSVEEEAAIILRVIQLLQHPNSSVIGQNFLYDIQYLYRHYHFLPRFAGDTMLAHHLVFPGTSKGLDFLSSIYCTYHMFWKAEGKDWHKSMQEDILWEYNCKDCVITFEVWEETQKLIARYGLGEQWKFQLKLWHQVLQTMLRGIRIDYTRREKLKTEIGLAITERNEKIQQLLGHPLNIKSPLQMKKLLYDDLQLPPQKNRKTGKVTTDDEALDRLSVKEPLIHPLLAIIRELRSLSVFSSTFIEATPDPFDARMRCYFNPAGTETFRLSSSEDAFGSGMNLQNLPKGDEE